MTAAIYLARFHLSVAVLDDNTGRARSIPMSHNHAGFPEGISGEELLCRMQSQAVKYGAEIFHGKVDELGKVDGTFVARLGDTLVEGRAVLVATGTANRRPAMPPEEHDEAVARGLLRYCPVCDGFEVTDKPVAVIGSGSRGFKEAMFLRGYTKDLTLFVPESDLTAGEIGRLKDVGIRVEQGPITSIVLGQDTISLATATGVEAFASVYPALGSDARSELAAGLGARLSDEGCILVDDHQRTSVPGVYAAGDVVIGLDQISSAMGQAGVAATTMRNDLSEKVALIR
ncbi:NAD(P)/FAD-dependent oxidoreductase [Mycoplana dimorpha]|uniref:Thioredoxin reductase n=1 Tax=Mycoplana dimorpha TaxID=28320 RepID=A0A2T5B598_MYCDI|nr:thioredoxin reductase (NADPH) [Mycoplana dimorpha]